MNITSNIFFGWVLLKSSQIENGREEDDEKTTTIFVVQPFHSLSFSLTLVPFLFRDVSIPVQVSSLLFRCIWPEFLLMYPFHLWCLISSIFHRCAQTIYDFFNHIETRHIFVAVIFFFSRRIHSRIVPEQSPEKILYRTVYELVFASYSYNKVGLISEVRHVYSIV